ncbi:MAG TPA: aminotransferase class III-fold pyridoxal phosphate-dependent enzyme [Polyangiaceae bacterium]|jgi:acetylornithine/N-succinyldiaminopimelate aminotransferase|nr:aminotransferase class III-fold pyridoxal phosphate-dependent enzyme [Polyangiaceae bacterium]
MLPHDVVHVLPTAPKPDLVAVRGHGSFLYDAEGREYLDFVQGWAVNALGHAPPAIARVLTEQAGRLWTASPAFHNAPYIALATRLAGLARMDHVYVCATGAEANEGAIKLARKWGSVHRGGAYEIVTTEGSFHGRTLATMSASGKPTFARLFEPKVPGFRKVPFGDAEAMARAVDERTVAIMVEPVQGEAGVVVPPEGYLRALREIADRAGILLLLDEVQTGVGRVGPFFAHEHEAIRPDVVTLGKGLGAGIPVAATICTRAANCFEPGDQGGTHVGNALLCAVALAVVNTVADPAFLEGVRARSERLVDRLRAIGDGIGGTVRGRGMLQALVLDAPIAEATVIECRARGLLLNAPRPDVLRFMPSLVVSDVEIDRMAEILRDTLRALRP